MTKPKQHSNRGYIILGAGGHAKVLIDILLLNNKQIAGIINPKVPSDCFFQTFNYLGDDQILQQLDTSHYFFVNGLGSSVDTEPRTQLFLSYCQQQAIFPKIIHPQAVISNSARISDGCHILAGAIVGPDTQLSENIIVNSRVIVEHDCQIASHCHIASGAILCGGVRVGHNTHIGAGATINPGVTVAANSTIASGAVVISDTHANSLYAGVPALKKR